VNPKAYVSNVNRQRIVFFVIVVLTFSAITGVAFVAFLWIDGGDGAPTRPVHAIPVDPSAPGSGVFDVVSENSLALFIIEEVLRGDANTVVGRTDQIDGSLAIEFQTGQVDIGPVEINLRSIRTDDELRDRTIRSRILNSNRDEYEFATFHPTEVTGTPDGVAAGDTLSLAITGDLRIRGVIREVTFAMDLNVHTYDQIQGIAYTEISRADFGIVVPYVGGNSIVSQVNDTVELRMEFVALRRE